MLRKALLIFGWLMSMGLWLVVATQVAKHHDPRCLIPPLDEEEEIKIVLLASAAGTGAFYSARAFGKPKK